MKSKKIISMLVAFAVTAAAMLSVTVFASDVLPIIPPGDYTITVANDGKQIEFINKPFVENGEVYLPLRETFEKTGVMEHPDSKIEWNNGKVDLCVAYYADAAVTAEHKSLNNGKGVENVSFVYNCAIEIGKPSIILDSVPNLSGQDISSEKQMNNAPILKDSNTYIPYSYISELLDASEWDIDCVLYDSNGNKISLS